MHEYDRKKQTRVGSERVEFFGLENCGLDVVEVRDCLVCMCVCNGSTMYKVFDRGRTRVPSLNWHTHPQAPTHPPLKCCYFNHLVSVFV